MPFTTITIETSVPCVVLVVPLPTPLPRRVEPQLAPRRVIDTTGETLADVIQLPVVHRSPRSSVARYRRTYGSRGASTLQVLALVLLIGIAGAASIWVAGTMDREPAAGTP